MIYQGVNYRVNSAMQVTNLNKAVSICLPFLFLLKPYGYGISDLCTTLSFVLALFCFILQRGRIRTLPTCKAFLLFTAYCVFRIGLTGITGVSDIGREYIMTIIRYIVFTASIVILTPHINEDVFYKTWRALGVIAGITIIIQAFQVYVLGQKVYMLLLMKPAVSSVMANVWYAANNRPLGLFQEPSHVACFMMPILFVSFQKGRMRYAIFFTIIMLLTGSSSAIIGLGFIWMMFVLSKDISKRVRRITILLFVIMVIVIMFMPIFSATIDKLLFEASGESNNFYSRVTGGWYLYSAMDTTPKLFGINNINMTDYIRSHSEMLAYASLRRTSLGYNYFVNTAQRIFILLGAVGALFYALMLRSIYKKSNKTIRPYFWLTVVEMLYSWNFYTSNYYVVQMYTLFVFGKRNEQENGAESINKVS